MGSNTPRIEELRESFALIYDGPDRLQREYDLIQEAERLNMPLDHYRRLYELRTEEPIDPYPKSKLWRDIPNEWRKWFIKLPREKKLSLLRKGIVKLVQSGAIISVLAASGHYLLTIPARQQQVHYQAWLLINSAESQKASGGRIEALQNLNKDGIKLRNLTINNADLTSINLKKAYLYRASFQEVTFNQSNFQNANLVEANLISIRCVSANFQSYVNSTST